MKKRRSLADSVLETARNSKPGPTAWVDVLPAAVRRELVRVKDAYQMGRVDVRKYALARSVQAKVKELGHRCINTAGVVRWLDSN